ncbi:MAG: SUF system NifU family Fe-S cluster assembly protein [Alphaproteobacteria bacterium]|nr:SUF system NifU family Fe-S cluster assembly protein [Alphaproteobacteria bacterium]
MSNDLRDLYQDLILDHSKHPRNFRPLPGANREALGHNPLCGDKLSLHLIVDNNDVIQDIAFQGAGCAISVASASMMSEMLKGKTIQEAEKLFAYLHEACTGGDADATGLDEDAIAHIDALSGVRDYPIRVKCATLAWHTLEAALNKKKTTSTE